uniref:Uncharacterized protein n=1 Tax=Picea glauca TaxID=3330 RepID=A0A101M3Q2_PICGL|nr:hypothetical protein ABT39_MTgene141 [Picea glauca]KUM50299.1 hypothetical protein ABT39_MTgene142 [Picea glauca]KUM50322.1 hypothetical protein ABT39_MTgene165 [Picea glauca]
MLFAFAVQHCAFTFLHGRSLQCFRPDSSISPCAISHSIRVFHHRIGVENRLILHLRRNSPYIRI